MTILARPAAPLPRLLAPALPRRRVKPWLVSWVQVSPLAFILIVLFAMPTFLFAVVSFGGVLGMGEKYHPVPWSELDYDPDRGGYTVSFTAEQLKNAPSDSIEALTKGDGRTFRDRAFTHYGTKPYWH